MRLLLDTHARLCWLAGGLRLPVAARAAIDAPGADVLVSAVSLFAIATKHCLGKLPLEPAVAADLAGTVVGHGFAHLPLDPRSAELAGRLPGPQRDPFDRLLVAQAITADLALVSNEAGFDAYGIRRLWWGSRVAAPAAPAGGPRASLTASPGHPPTVAAES
ncbi:MAG TPA: type II toxin-antitoxin system VapC family toxin [Geminicoccaceae bacterium]|nr:type II toxin-antitoxin system VapC family toxin [Geminicoccaceae bacterium]